RVSPGRTDSRPHPLPASQRPLFVAEPAEVMLHLPARRAWQAPRLQQHEVMQMDPVPLRNGLTHIAQATRPIAPPPAALDLLNKPAPGPPTLIRLAPRRASRVEARVCVIYRLLNVLRVMVPPVDDEQVLEPSRDVQFAAVQVAEVAGTQERPLAGVAQERAER